MIQSKTGQRARSRRRAGDSHEAMAVPNPVSRGVTSAPIIVDDEEDDVVVSSPRSFAQVPHAFRCLIVAITSSLLFSIENLGW